MAERILSCSEIMTKLKRTAQDEPGVTDELHCHAFDPLLMSLPTALATSLQTASQAAAQVVDMPVHASRASTAATNTPGCKGTHVQVHAGLTPGCKGTHDLVADAHPQLDTLVPVHGATHALT